MRKLCLTINYQKKIRYLKLWYRMSLKILRN